MALPPAKARTGGYATVAAMMASLAIAIIATAVVSFASAERRAAQAAVDRVALRGLLDAGHLLAAAALRDNGQPGRLSWNEVVSETQISILAEPETAKIDIHSLDATSQLILSLHPRSPRGIFSKITASTAIHQTPSIGDLDDSLSWRACAPSVLSFWGKAKNVELTGPVTPIPTSLVGEHANEIWRVVVEARGWSDERIVRLTGGADLVSLISQAVRPQARDVPACPGQFEQG